VQDQVEPVLGHHASWFDANNLIDKTIIIIDNSEMTSAPGIDAPIGNRIQIGSARLWRNKLGEGAPRIVFLPGAGEVGLDLYALQQGVADLAPSLLYDRSGMGWSEPVRLPRSLAQVTDELNGLLAQEQVSSPVVLVGHSLGGLYARRYAQRFPGRVAGLVLLDPAHEDYNAAMPGNSGRASALATWMMKVQSAVLAAALRSNTLRRLVEGQAVIRRYQALYRELFSKEMSPWPAHIRDPLVDAHVSLEWLLRGIKETENVEDLYAETRAGGGLPDIPTIILSSSEADDFRRAVMSGSEDLLAAEIEAKHRLYERLAAPLTQGSCRRAEGGHVTMGFRNAALVRTAIEDVLAMSA
jgi:pimeloyl-ACP methyl ester carboxylesterase